MILTREMEASLLEARKREQDFWNRHGIGDEGQTYTGIASEAHRAWVKAVEYEYSITDGDARQHLDTPLARQAFILGFRLARKDER